MPDPRLAQQHTRPATRHARRAAALTALAVAGALSITATAPAHVQQPAASPAGAACHEFQRFSELWQLCPAPDGSQQPLRIGAPR
jgi:hypothetical protein